MNSQILVNFKQGARENEFYALQGTRGYNNAAREFALGEFPDMAQEFDREEKFDLSI
jgi:hypothetical protein